MRLHKFSVNIPVEYVEKLDSAALNRFRRAGMRNQMLIDILHAVLAPQTNGQLEALVLDITHNNQDATIKTKRKRATV